VKPILTKDALPADYPLQGNGYNGLIYRNNELVAGYIKPKKSGITKSIEEFADRRHDIDLI
jgi:hypothetical protein